MADVPVQSGTYSIGEVAKITGTTVKTVRYYDQIGLVKPVTHTEGGHRLYTTEEIWRLELILTLRYLSFGIEDIRKIISGEIPVSTALDWQIEALSTQQRMISNMISILQRAKEGDHGEESLRHIRELVESVHINTEERKKFILDKIQESMFIDQFPPDWHESLVQSVIGVLPKEGKLTSGQSAAWTELEELLNSTEFHQEFRESMGLFIKVVNQYLIDPEKWTKKMMESFEQLSVAIQNRESPDSPAVQEVIDDLRSRVCKYAADLCHSRAASSVYWGGSHIWNESCQAILGAAFDCESGYEIFNPHEKLDVRRDTVENCTAGGRRDPIVDKKNE
ncbi:MerR family transcriptional regulator [Brevibacillus reuszeri]|uniref:MerR family transcriptional regulator n=1 Tax=Brevibacillus reuszeri TaxID=54915 RepID=UPI000CCC2E82|nr:MerR family transcriptional regulator [Brevibacillus reuszeri]